MNHFLVRWTVVAVSMGLLAACDESTEPTDADPAADAGSATDAATPTDASPATNTIADIAAGDPQFSILLAAASRASLAPLLATEGPFTVFAPTNAAFEASGITQADVDAMDLAALTNILRYHVLVGVAAESTDLVAGPVDSAARDATDQWNLDLIVGTTGGVTLNGGNTVAGGANVVAADVVADNGVVHVIDRVLLPPDVPTMATYAGLTDLVEAVVAADLADTLSGSGPFTVFAPTNEAFPDGGARPTGAALTTVLTYHVLSGGVRSSAVPPRADALATNEAGNPMTLLFDTTDGVAVNGIEVVIADVGCTNGIVHVIGGVLLPPSVTDMAGIAGLTELAGAIAIADGGGAGIGALLSGEAPGDATGFTVFAPTNEAFEAIASTVATLSPAEVADVLRFHVLDPATFEAPVLSTDLANGDVATALSGASATVDVSVTPPTIEGQPVVPTLLDIHVANGVIHVVGGVLLPPS